MKIAFSTLGCPDWAFTRVVETAHQLGYDGVELRFLDGSLDLLRAQALDANTREWAVRFLEEMKVEICCLDSSVRFDDPRAMHRAAQKQVGMEYIDRASAMGIPFVRVFGDKISDAATRARVINWVVDGLTNLGVYAEDKNVTVLLESHGDFSQSEALREVMERVDSPQVGVLWDTHHPWRFYGESPADTVARIGRWIKHTHWKDSMAQVAAPSAASQQAEAEAHREMTAHQHANYVLFGEGEFPAAEALTALRAIGYDGWCALEWEKKWHPEIAEPEVAFPQFIERMRALLAAA